MRFLPRLLFAAALSFTVAGCAGTRLGDAYTALTSVAISANGVTYAVSGFEAVKITATNYMRLRRCDGTNSPVCRDPKLTATIDAYVQSGSLARDRLKAFERAHPGQLGAQGDYDLLVSATQTLTDALAAYKSAIK